MAEVYCFIHEALRPVGKGRRQIAAVPPSNSRPGVDFNAPHTDWLSLEVSPMAGGRRQEQQRLIDISLDHNIEQTIDKPTRGGNILDILFTNNKSTLQNVVIKPPLGKSDHDIIYAEINVWPNRVCTPHRKVFVFRKADWDGIKRKLKALFEKMQENSKQPPVNELWNTFKITLLDGMREFIPQKMTKSKHCLPWVTLNIRKLMRSKRRLHTKLKKTQCPKVLDKYKEMRHTLQREIGKSSRTAAVCLLSYRTPLVQLTSTSLSNPQPTEHCIHLELPLSNAHTDHILTAQAAAGNHSFQGETVCVCSCWNNVNTRNAVKEKLYAYVAVGIMSTPMMRRLLRQFVNDDLVSKEHVTVNKLDRANFPISRDIRNYIHSALVAGQYSGLDEENLQKKVVEWKETDPSANVFLHLCTEAGSECKNSALQTETGRGFTTNQSERDDEYDAGETSFFSSIRELH